ncbi:MAG: hypothetical protein DMG57_22540 [Acidobacteria bacterium]|nr:MAG: hypothetical protein DMG57_22540 [Acidobacteriota bacterium]
MTSLQSAVNDEHFFGQAQLRSEPDSSKNFSWVDALRGNQQDCLRLRRQEHFSGWLEQLLGRSKSAVGWVSSAA